MLLDISPRILDHVTRARTRAASGTGYTLNLPLTKATPWEAEIRKYWQNFGDQIGAPAPGAGLESDRGSGRTAGGACEAGGRAAPVGREPEYRHRPP